MRTRRAAFPDAFDEPPPPAEARYRDVIPETLRGVDRALGTFAGALEPDSTRG